MTVPGDSKSIGSVIQEDFNTENGLEGCVLPFKYTTKYQQTPANRTIHNP